MPDRVVKARLRHSRIGEAAGQIGETSRAINRATKLPGVFHVMVAYIEAGTLLPQATGSKPSGPRQRSHLRVSGRGGMGPFAFFSLTTRQYPLERSFEIKE